MAAEQGGIYRIVALGESTTFGITLDADDRPWPELLEEMIRTRLKLPRRVEVINAGLPGYHLKHNLYRLPREILPLKPDMIISYHGHNGFYMLDAAIPRASGKPPPVYRERPLRLLADSEYRVKLLCYKALRHARTAPVPAPSNPMETAYARGYHELVEIARTNQIRLVLANYSMAVNAQSPPELVEFYRLHWPTVFREIKVNELHSRIVREIASHHPEVCFVDTHPHLDGEDNKFIDLVHFTQEGRRQMAETMFAGIKSLLMRDVTTQPAEPREP